MVDDRIQKATVENNELPPLSTDGNYYVRYRIVSEDRNRVSHWSPIHQVEAGYTFVPGGDLSVQKISNHVLAIWNPVVIKKGNNIIRKAKEYDMWLRWHRSDAGDWAYFERVEGTTLTILPPSTYTINGVTQSSEPNRLDVELYLAGNPISRSDSPTALLKVYSKPNTTI